MGDKTDSDSYVFELVTIDGGKSTAAKWVELAK